MLRTVKRQDTRLSRWVASYIDAGKLAPDHLVMRIVAQRLQSDECANGALLTVSSNDYPGPATGRLFGRGEVAAQLDMVRTEGR